MMENLLMYQYIMSNIFRKIKIAFTLKEKNI
jgi:hypothetical protein